MKTESKTILYLQLAGNKMKMLIFSIALFFVFSVSIGNAIAQQGDIYDRPMKLDNTDYPAKITYDKMLKNIEEVTDWQVIDSRIKLIEEALASPFVSDEQKKEFKTFKPALLSAELALLTQTIDNKNIFAIDENDETKILAELSNRKNSIIKELKEINETNIKN